MLDVGINFVPHYSDSWAGCQVSRGKAGTPDNWASPCSVEGRQWPSGLWCPTPTTPGPSHPQNQSHAHHVPHSRKIFSPHNELDILLTPATVMQEPKSTREPPPMKPNTTLRKFVRWKGLECFFSEYLWYRKLAGGKWMQTFVDHPVCSCLWLSVPDDADENYREPLWRGTPRMEKWP